MLHNVHRSKTSCVNDVRHLCVLFRILKKSDDGRRQSKPDLSDLPKRPITADPTKQCSKGISRHKVTLAENEPMLLQRPITKSSKRPKSSDASKRSVMFTSGTRGVERPMSSSGSIHWRKQMGYRELCSSILSPVIVDVSIFAFR